MISGYTKKRCIKSRYKRACLPVSNTFAGFCGMSKTALKAFKDYLGSKIDKIEDDRLLTIEERNLLKKSFCGCVR